MRGGKDVIDNDYDVDYRYARPVNGVYYGYRDSGYERAAKALVSDMQAYNSIWFFKLPNKQRATNPWNYASGLQTYLDRRNQGLTNKYKLAAKSHYGWGPIAWGRTLDILKQQFSREQPVVGLEFSLGIQHSGVLKSFNWDPFGDLWADLQYGPVSGRTSLNLSAWWVPIAGVYWIEEAP
ncbi:hypothetical protein DAERI_180045 [Deinococcus aerius]|uniref:Uncharacterized protein n=1 Tax=Deinococcus aerius TaxID=200253 RepID=A0A2I9D007_9DEIO|nr:hypothetical protein DAERI_180045 [Deinococcus aerius]